MTLQIFTGSSLHTKLRIPLQSARSNTTNIVVFERTSKVLDGTRRDRLGYVPFQGRCCTPRSGALNAQRPETQEVDDAGQATAD